ncbi:hypothetical protein [Novosphingobium sp.]|uniref:hypothetical protein n=1 Tax=Novosphingobium sp. TaxID=1874826 RepID=UPI00286B406A|nr:hypothetical protein [Novosphingobium sp.]
MQHFSVEERKRRLADITGLSFQNDKDKEEYASLGALDSASDHTLTVAIYCIFVGYHEDARRLLERAHDWISTSIMTNEINPNFHDPHASEAARFSNFATCKWLLDLGGASAVQSQCLDELRIYYNDRDNVRGKLSVILSFHDYLDAKAYAEGLELCERTGIASPASLSAIRNEAQMGRVLCEHALGRKHSAEKVDSALHMFLKRSVNTWLLDGHSTRAAQWMKLAHWRDGGELSSFETVLKCFDYLPAESRL